VILCTAFRFVTILLKARHEEVIVRRIAYCLRLFIKSGKPKEKERRENVHPGMGINLKLGSPEWHPSVLTNTPCHIYYLLWQFFPMVHDM
jgi:hypothetical protein